LIGGTVGTDRRCLTTLGVASVAPTEPTPERAAVPHNRHGVSARRRVTVCAIAGGLVGGAASLVIPAHLAALLGWDVAALTFLGWVWASLWPLDPGQTARHAEREDPTRTAADLLVLGAALASLVAVGFLIVRVGPSGRLAELVQVGFGITSVVLSWSMIHTVFALRYAWLYYDGENGGITFHQDGEPRYSDFAYLAFTIGMTYQVSDTELNAPVIRADALRHSLLSFVFGTVIIALTINLVAGLSK
jgi:uncharacterized membrane protein